MSMKELSAPQIAEVIQAIGNDKVNSSDVRFLNVTEATQLSGIVATDTETDMLLDPGRYLMIVSGDYDFGNIPNLFKYCNNNLDTDSRCSISICGGVATILCLEKFGS